MRRHLTYANVVSTLALCLVVGGGGAYAATQLTKNSVRSKHIAKGAVTSSDIKDRGVALRDLAADVTGKNGEAGLKGDPGPVGPVGPIGPIGPAGKDGAAGQDLSFDGIRLGKLERHPVTGSGTANSPRIPLGTVGPLDVYAQCYSVNGSVRTFVGAERQAGSDATGIVYGGTNPNGWTGISSGVGLQSLDSATVTAQFAATLILYTGEAWDVRGAVYRQSDAGGPFGAGSACGFTPIYVEKISR